MKPSTSAMCQATASNHTIDAALRTSAITIAILEAADLLA